jgi:hypothetical protein
MEQVMHPELRVILTRYACRLPNQVAPRVLSLTLRSMLTLPSSSFLLV